MAKGEIRDQIPQYVLEARNFMETVCKPAECENLQIFPKRLRCIAKDPKEIARDFNALGECDMGKLNNVRKTISLPVSETKI